ncbi:MAG TPA: lamin tail domain-containing protein, partial [Anaeromyxobacter sp.]
RRSTGAAAVLALLACGLPVPERLPRIAGASPQGEGVSTLAVAELRFEVPVDPDGLLDGARLVLVGSDALRAAIAAVESDEGAAALAGAVAVAASLEDGGARVVLRPRAPLRGFTAYALVLSSRVRAADGRAMLDPEGRRRTFVSSFSTGAPEGPPPAPALTEVLVDAATPEAGGEYVEVVNRGLVALDLAGWRLAKRTATGALASCAIVVPAGAAPLAPGALALLAGGAWDGRYALPAGVPVLACGATALLGGIANDRAPDLLLADPGGTVRATLGAAGAPICPVALEKVDPYGADVPENLACTEGSPGLLP